jgi:hypothetical protein
MSDEPQQVADQRFYIEVERTQYSYVELVARSKDEADEMVAAMTPEEIMENTDDWDWDGQPPYLTDVTLTEDELIARGEVAQGA